MASEQGNLISGEWEPRAPTPGARLSDPTTSQHAVSSIVKDTSLQGMILKVFEHRHAGVTDLTDGELTYLLDKRYPERRFQRNVVARSRLELERKGLLHRGPPRPCRVMKAPAITFSREPPSYR